MPVPTKVNDGLFISNSFDATSHFENETENVLNLYKAMTGKDLDLENLPNDDDEQWHIDLISMFIFY